MANIKYLGALVVAILGLSACGGGGGGGSSSGSSVSIDSWQAGVYQPSSSFAAKCASPRSGSSAYTGKPYPDMQGQAVDERNWLRSWTHELYLWYGEVTDLDPTNYTTPDYFDQMKTMAVTASGRPKDRFHFTYTTAQWESIEYAGTEAGYGLQWELVSATPPRRAVVAYLEPNAPTSTTSTGVTRGYEIASIDGVDIDDGTQAGIDTLNAGLYPASAGESHTFVIKDLNGVTHNVTLTAVNAQDASVMNVETIDTGAGGTVGYLQFNNHLYPAEQALIDAIDQLKAANGGAGVTDLILDMRYNGGGLLDVASELAYMIAGPGPTAGETFELTQFNDKYPSTDPVTGKPITPTPFHDKAVGFSAAQNTPLPTLNLTRVFVLTQAGTCSASESVINGLRGVNVEVIQVGSTTCGKPYGFYPQDNCGTTYFSIEFRGVNAQNFGDYGNGFSPSNTSSIPGVSVPGCSVADDFTQALGDSAEQVLSAALSYRQSGNCPAATGQSASGRVQAQSASAAVEGGLALRRPFWRENRILR